MPDIESLRLIVDKSTTCFALNEWFGGKYILPLGCLNVLYNSFILSDLLNTIGVILVMLNGGSPSGGVQIDDGGGVAVLVHTATQMPTVARDRF